MTMFDNLTLIETIMMCIVMMPVGGFIGYLVSVLLGLEP